MHSRGTTLLGERIVHPLVVPIADETLLLTQPAKPAGLRAECFEASSESPRLTRTCRQLS